MPEPQDEHSRTTAGESEWELIAQRAYELYRARGGEEGRALDDWLRAEQELAAASRRVRDQTRKP